VAEGRGSASDVGANACYCGRRSHGCHQRSPGYGFPDDNYLTFLSAESKGHFFLAHIRDRFRSERMAKLSAA